jgi:hypothetical protein
VVDVGVQELRAGGLAVSIRWTVRLKLVVMPLSPTPKAVALVKSAAANPGTGVKSVNLTKTSFTVLPAAIETVACDAWPGPLVTASCAGRLA